MRGKSQFFQEARLDIIRPVFMKVYDSIYLKDFYKTIDASAYRKISDFPLPSRVKLELRKVVFDRSLSEELLKRRIQVIHDLFSDYCLRDPVVVHVEPLLKVLLEYWNFNEFELMRLTCDRVCQDVSNARLSQGNSVVRVSCCC